MCMYNMYISVYVHIRGDWTSVIKINVTNISRAPANIKCIYKHMAGISRTLLCLAKDAVGKELGEP